jgi:hypothetical protein
MRHFQWLVVLTVGLALVASDAGAGAKDKKKNDTAEPARVEEPISFEPNGLAFGLAHKAVAEVYDKVIDQDHADELNNAQPGPELTRLESSIQEEKDRIRKSLLELEDPPSNLDGTAFEGEFTYHNKEAVMRVDRAGKKRTLFFIRDKMWKIIDLYDLGPKAKFGADFKAAVAKLEELTGVEGRALAAKPDEGRRFDEVDWADEKIHLRAIKWGKKLAIAYVDRATEARLGELRKNKPKKQEDIDPAVKDVLRGKK